MLLFVTRDAFFKFSIEDRFGEGDAMRSEFSEPKSREWRFVWSFQNARGELKGEVSKGDDPRLVVASIFCSSQSAMVSGRCSGLNVPL